MLRIYWNKHSDKEKLKLFILISISIHLLFLLFKAPSLITKNKFLDEEEKVIKIRLSPEKKKQIVQTQESKDKLKKLKDAYLGAKDNFVERETKAQDVGSFKKAGIGQKDGVDKKIVQQKTTPKEKKVKDISLKDLSVNPNLKELEKEVQQDQILQAAKGLKNGSKEQTGLSQSNDYLQDVELGDFTQLNTQEFKFYGFYHRIRQKLEQFWGVNIKEQADKIMKSGRSIASGENHITSLVIVLNDKGEITNVNIKSTSGIKELDDAAIDSFNQAGPFPNPPKEMLKNGQAVIEWGFVVNT